MAELYRGTDLLLIAEVVEDTASAFVTSTPRILSPAGGVSLPESRPTKTIVRDGNQVGSYKVGSEPAISIKVAALDPDMMTYLRDGEDSSKGYYLDEITGSKPRFFALGFRLLKSNANYEYYWLLKGQISVNAITVDSRIGTTAVGQQITFKPVYTIHKFSFSQHACRIVMADGAKLGLTPERWSAVVWTPDNFAAVPMPQINPGSGAFVGEAVVMMRSIVATDTVRYTLDGTDPTLDSPVYTEPFAVTENVTIKAIECAMCGNKSGIATVSLQIVPEYPYLTIFPEDGDVVGVYPQIIITELGTQMPIYYTLDGTDPTLDSPVYTGPIPMPDHPVQIKARCFCTVRGEFNDNIVSRTYWTTYGINLAFGNMCIEFNNKYIMTSFYYDFINFENDQVSFDEDILALGGANE